MTGRLLRLNTCIWLFHPHAIHLKGHLCLSWKDYPHAVTDEFLYLVAGCGLMTDVCHLMFKKRSTWFKVKSVSLCVDLTVIYGRTFELAAVIPQTG